VFVSTDLGRRGASARPRRQPSLLGRFSRLPPLEESYPRSIGLQPSLGGVQPLSEHVEESDRHARVLDQDGPDAGELVAEMLTDPDPEVLVEVRGR
jgi:hypothetical protein